MGSTLSLASKGQLKVKVKQSHPDDDSAVFDVSTLSHTSCKDFGPRKYHKKGKRRNTVLADAIDGVWKSSLLLRVVKAKNVQKSVSCSAAKTFLSRNKRKVQNKSETMLFLTPKFNIYIFEKT